MARKQFVTIDSFASLLTSSRFHDPATTSTKPSPAIRRQAAQTASHNKQAAYAIQQIAKEQYVSNGKSPNLDDLSSLAGNSNTPWHSFSSRFRALSVAMREEFPFWHPDASTTFVDIYRQLNHFCQYHAVEVSEFAYHVWYKEALKGILREEVPNWKKDDVQRISKLVERV